VSRLVILSNRMLRPGQVLGGGDGAVIGKPYNAETTVDRTEWALRMRLDGFKERWRIILRYFLGNDIAVWRLSFIRTLADARPKP